MEEVREQSLRLMHVPTTKLETSLGLSMEFQAQLEKKWTAIVEDPLAFVPSEFRDVVSEEYAVEANTKMGEFAASCLKGVLRRSSPADICRREGSQKRLVAVGAGRGYDSHFVCEAVDAGLRTLWVDVSARACQFAESSVESQFEECSIRGTARHLRPKVVQAEIRTALSDPGSFGFQGLDSVEIWYLCRVLGILSGRSAKIVLQRMGGSLRREIDSANHHSLIIVSALRDDNPTRIAKTSKLYTRKMILSNVRLGAGRPVEVETLGTHMYFDQQYSAIRISAK